MTDRTKSKLMKVLIYTMWIVITGLVGVLYANMNSRIDRKAEQSEVEMIKEGIRETRIDVRDIKNYLMGKGN